MGLFGGLIVRPALGAGGAHLLYGGHANTQYDPKREVVHLLSDVDPDLHIAVDKGRPHATEGFRPRYWFINGRGFPDTAAPNFADWLPNQPYGSEPARAADLDARPPRRRSLAGRLRHAARGACATSTRPRRRTRSTRTPPTRSCTASTAARSSRRPGVDLTENHYSVEIAPGQTMDATWSYEYVGTHTAGGVNVPFNPASNPVPVPVQDFRDTRWTPATYASGTPYLGIQDDLPDGITTLNECGEYYSVSHSHAVEEATTYGAAGGGMLTLYRIDPPGHEGCTP